MKKLINFLKESNRWKHLIGGIIVGATCGIPAAIAVGGALEFKDKQWGGAWDWIDFGLTALGGVLGGWWWLLVL